MTISANFPALKPSLLLDFANVERLDPRITFTRASNATYFDANGVLQTASSGVARFDHNPTTLESLGLLIEEQRTNSIRNNTMQGAVAGTPGTMPTNYSTFTSLTGLTRQVVGTGTEDGISYVDVKVSGTPSGSGIFGIYFETATGVAALSGQTWTSSNFCKLVAGSMTGITQINNTIAENNSGGTYLTGNSTAFTPTSSSLSSQRRSHTRTLNNASTVFVFPYYDLILTGVAIDFTLRIGLPQLELGAFATSVIPTTTAAATRNADVATMTGTNFSSWYNATEGTLYVDGVPVLNGTNVLCAINNGTNDEAINIYWNSNLVQFQVRDNSTTQASITGSRTVPFKVAGAYKANDFSAACNDTSLGVDLLGTVPTPDQMRIGNLTGGSFVNGHIRRIAYYPVRLGDAQLQALTR